MQVFLLETSVILTLIIRVVGFFLFQTSFSCHFCHSRLFQHFYYIEGLMTLIFLTLVLQFEDLLYKCSTFVFRRRYCKLGNYLVSNSNTFSKYKKLAEDPHFFDFNHFFNYLLLAIQLTFLLFYPSLNKMFKIFLKKSDQIKYFYSPINVKI